MVPRDLGNWLMWGKKRHSLGIRSVGSKGNQQVFGGGEGDTLQFTPVTLTLTPMNVLVYDISE